MNLKLPLQKSYVYCTNFEDDKTRENLQRAFRRMDDIIKELATVEKLTSKNTMIYKERDKFFINFKKTTDLMLINPDNIEQNRGFWFEADIYMISI